MDRPQSPRRSRALEVALVFLRIGATAFGGPAAHVGLLEDEIVRRRRWVSRQEFLDLLGATNIIPGPNSTQMCIHLGYRRAGLPGLILGGVCFVLPAMALTGLLAWLYVRLGTVPAVGFLLYGIKPAVLAVIVGAIARLARTALKGPFLVGVTVAAIGLSLAGAGALVVLLGGGAVGIARAILSRRGAAGTAAVLGASSELAGRGGTALALGAAASSSTAVAAPSLLSLALFFLKVGSVLYGTGYVLVAFLRGGLVAGGWLTESQLLDAVAIGQFTPGPLLTTATVIGYLLLSWEGAIIATAAFILPSFVLVWLTHRWIAKMRTSPVVRGFLDTINAAAVGLMAAVIVQLAREALVGWPAWVIGAIAAAGVLTVRVSPTWWILGGAVLGLAAHVAGLAG